MTRVPLIVYLDHEEHITIPQHGGDLSLVDFLQKIFKETKTTGGRIEKVAGLDHSRAYAVYTGKSHSISVGIQLLHALGYEPKFVTEASL